MHGLPVTSLDVLKIRLSGSFKVVKFLVDLERIVIEECFPFASISGVNVMPSFYTLEAGVVITVETTKIK